MKEMSMFKKNGYKHLLGQLFIFSLSECLAADLCPDIPPNAVKPQISFRLDMDASKSANTFFYEIENSKDSLLPIQIFRLLIDHAPSNEKSPEHWDTSYDNNKNPNRREFRWDTSSANFTLRQGFMLEPSPFLVFPGKKLTGLSIQSPRSAGVIQYVTDGYLMRVPTATPTDDDDEPTPDCPGFNFEAGLYEDSVIGATVGPARTNSVSLHLKIKNTKKSTSDENEPDSSNPLEDEIVIDPDKESGMIRAEVRGERFFGTEKFDLKSIDVSSLRLGFGKAPAVSSKIEGQKLKLEFDLKKVGIRCDLDLALFLSGKTTDGKDIVAAAPIKKHLCKHTRDAKPIDLTPKATKAD